VIKFVFRLLKWAMLSALAATVVAKLLLESHGDPDTEEIDLISIFDGVVLASEASPFYGGKILNSFGGTTLDLRRAQPGPTGVHLDLAVLFGGVLIVVPEGWRVRSDLRVFAGGFDDATRTDANPDAIAIALTGFVAFGGVQVRSKPLIEVST
jgi:hypothetical protein